MCSARNTLVGGVTQCGTQVATTTPTFTVTTALLVTCTYVPCPLTGSLKTSIWMSQENFMSVSNHQKEQPKREPTQVVTPILVIGSGIKIASCPWIQQMVASTHRNDSTRSASKITNSYIATANSIQLVAESTRDIGASACIQDARSNTQQRESIWNLSTTPTPLHV